ncbi:RHS repeat-associated core domain-containing protein, partial [Xanthomonas codiaei]
NATGAVVRRYDYTPYGQAQATGGSSDNPYQYTGRELDKSGLQYYRARYYSPEMGRFISEDSYGFAGGDANFYAYALGNPVSFNDPSGHFAWFAIPVIWAVIEAGLSVYDAYDTGKTLMDPCASTNEKALTAGMFVGGMFLPGGGYGSATKGALKRTGPVGVVPNRHNANVMVRGPGGEVLSHDRLVSGNMTPAEQALGFPRNTLASHTEARAVQSIPLKQGDTMTITGQRPPCPSCKGYMNRAAAETGATIEYQWRAGGSTQRWTATGN